MNAIFLDSWTNSLYFSIDRAIKSDSPVNEDNSTYNNNEYINNNYNYKNDNSW